MGTLEDRRFTGMYVRVITLLALFLAGECRGMTEYQEEDDNYLDSKIDTKDRKERKHVRGISLLGNYNEDYDYNGEDNEVDRLKLGLKEMYHQMQRLAQRVSVIEANLMKQPKKKDCVPYSKEACIAAAKANGMNLGGGGDGFEVNYGTTGCYYNKAYHYAFWGLGGRAGQPPKDGLVGMARPKGYDCKW